MKTITMRAALFAVGVLAARSALASEPLHYEPEVVRLSGTVVIEDHLGSPNYGEDPDTDMKVQSLVLVLDEPVTVIGNPEGDVDSETVEDVRRMQLVISPKFREGRQDLIGRHATFEGTLFHSFTGWHITAVLIHVNKIGFGDRQIDIEALDQRRP
jgi:hypothetical protein